MQDDQQQAELWLLLLLLTGHHHAGWSACLDAVSQFTMAELHSKAAAAHQQLHQPHTHFPKGLAFDNGLASLAGTAGPDASDKGSTAAAAAAAASCCC
jgi:hypothetical protein